MNNQLRQFNTMGCDDKWRTQSFRQSVVSKIEQEIERSGIRLARNSSEMESHVFIMAKTREEYMNMVAKLIVYIREMSHSPIGKAKGLPFIAAQPRKYIMRNSQEHYQTFSRGGLFPEWQYASSDAVPEQDELSYMPPLKQSCNVRVSSASGDGEWKTPRLFEVAENRVGSIGNSQMLGMVHMGARGGKNVAPMMGAGYAPRRQFLRNSPSPSAQSPMPVPSPVSMGMGGAMFSPMPSLGGMQCGAVGSPFPSTSSYVNMGHHPQHQQRGVSMGMVASPSSVNLYTLVGGEASPSGEEAAYREKVRQLSKYVEPLRRMVSEAVNAKKLQKIKNLLDVLSNPNKRMPLETLIKCEAVLEKLNFMHSEGMGLPLLTHEKEKIFNSLPEVVNNSLQSPFANHTLKRTIGSTLEPEIDPTWFYQGSIPKRAPVVPAATNDLHFEATVQSIMEMGFNRQQVEQALRASFNNKEQAVEYLITDIPQELPHEQEADESPIAFLRDQPQFHQMRAVIQQKPKLLNAVLLQIGQLNPALLQAIGQHQREFIQMLVEPMRTPGASFYNVIQMQGQI